MMTKNEYCRSWKILTGVLVLILVGTTFIPIACATESTRYEPTDAEITVESMGLYIPWNPTLSPQATQVANQPYSSLSHDVKIVIEAERV